MLLGKIFSSVRYFATVRRAIGMPRLLRISTISLSLSGALPSSFFTRSRIASFTLVLLIDSPVGGLIAGREKIFHLEHALRRGHVFAGDGAADGGLVHADRVGDLHHRHRFQLRRAVIEEIALPRNDLVRDVRNRLLALVDRFDQEFSASDFIADVILHFAAIAVLRHDVLVGVADAQMRNLFAVEDDLVFAVDFFDGHVWQDVILRRLGENLRRVADRVARCCWRISAPARR